MSDTIVLDEVTDLFILRLENAELKDTLAKERRSYSTLRAYQAAEKLLQATVADQRRQLLELAKKSATNAEAAQRAQEALRRCEYVLASFGVFALLALLVLCFSRHS